MKVVIQCAARKRGNAGFLRAENGTPVLFVADPSRAPEREGLKYARPDDWADRHATWRERLVEYNRARTNPLGLSPAWHLYANDAYGALVNRFGATEVFILSAGWGLIRGDFLTPQYDVTFSAAARQKHPFKYRAKREQYDDFNQLPSECTDNLVFFGGKDYLPLFRKLTSEYRGVRHVIYNAASPPEAPGCHLVRYATRTRTNWHYEAVKAYLAGQLVF